MRNFSFSRIERSGAILIQLVGVLTFFIVKLDCRCLYIIRLKYHYFESFETGVMQ